MILTPTSLIITVPTKSVLAVVTKDLFVLVVMNLSNENNVCKQSSFEFAMTAELKK